MGKTRTEIRDAGVDFTRFILWGPQVVGCHIAVQESFHEGQIGFELLSHAAVGGGLLLVGWNDAKIRNPAGNLYPVIILARSLLGGVLGFSLR